MTTVAARRVGRAKRDAVVAFVLMLVALGGGFFGLVAVGRVIKHVTPGQVQGLAGLLVALVVVMLVLYLVAFMLGLRSWALVPGGFSHMAGAAIVVSVVEFLITTGVGAYFLLLLVAHH